MPKKRRKRSKECTVALAPLSMYRDEAACRATIRYLKKQLRRAYQVLGALIASKYL